MNTQKQIVENRGIIKQKIATIKVKLYIFKIFHKKAKWRLQQALLFLQLALHFHQIP
jgi:hypothetical protein